MTIDLPSILVALLFSGVGFVYFSYGKKMSRFWFMIAGLGLMLFGYFIDSVWWSLGVGAMLSLLPFLIPS